jgi:hypothetical protein
MKDKKDVTHCHTVNILNLYLFVIQHSSNFIFNKHNVDTLSQTFIPCRDVGNKSISRMWVNIPTAAEEY